VPRNSAGTYTLPEDPFVANTPISSAAVNSDLSDIADAITDSLSRDGQGGMSAQLGLALSGFNYTSDPDTGISRSAANTQVITCGGEDWTFTTTDITTPVGVSLLPIIGEIRMWAFATAPTGWVLLQGQPCTTAYPLWRAALTTNGNPYGTFGGDPLFPNFCCVVPAGADPNGRGILTGAVLGALLGQQSQTIAQANLPNYSLPNTLGISDTRAWKTNNSLWGSGTTGARAGGTEFSATAATQDVSVVSGALGLTGGVTLGGSGTAISTVQPTLIINFIGRAA
jgi:microcystin-dependent protein